MKRYVGLALVLGLFTASTAVDAQVGGLLRKKAAEVVGKKPEPAKPAPAPATEPAPATGSTAPATPAAAPAATAKPAAKSNVSPLDPSALPIKDTANQVLRDGISYQLPYIPAAATAAAYALDDSARATLVETVGGAIKTLVMSSGYLAEHDAWVKDEHQGVDHGLKGVVTAEQAAKSKDFKQMEALQARMMVATAVDQVEAYPPDLLKQMFTQEMADWRGYAGKGSGGAKYQKMVTKGQSIASLPPSDPAFKRGYAVIKSIDFGGPDTEDAVYAVHARFKQEQEQAKYDQHSLKAQLKQNLTNFLAVASKVNFNAPTVEKNKRTVFVNAADEKQSAIWKACFRAGQPATAAAVKFAKAWLSEL